MTDAVAPVIGGTTEEYRDAFLARFDALGKALEVSGKENTTELPRLVRVLLEPYGTSGAVTIGEGPVVLLSSSQALALRG